MTKSLVEAQGYIDIAKGSSADFNKLIKSFSIDISNVFNATNDNEKNIRKNQDILIQENLFLYRKIKSLEEKMASVISAVEAAQGFTNNYRIYKTNFSAEGIYNVTALHDTSYGVMTLPYTDSQKASINLYPKDFLLKNIDIVVEYDKYDGLGNKVGETEYITIADDASLLNIMDLDDATFWCHTIKTDETVSRVDFKLSIKLPEKIVSNLFVNAIGIKPHPIYSLTLKNISYIDANNQQRLTIPNYPMVELPNKTKVREELHELDNIKFMFSAIMASKIEIEMSQNFYIKVGDERKFIIGIRGVDIENMNITSEQASFITELVIPGEEQYFKKVLEPKVYPLVKGDNYGDLVSHELLDSKDSEVPLVFGSDIGAYYKKLYVRTTIKRDGEVIPAIRGIEFGYVPKNS